MLKFVSCHFIKPALTLLFLLSLQFSHAQTYNRSIGLSLIPGTTNRIGWHTETRFAFSAGIDIEQRFIGERWYLQSGLQFIDRGYALRDVSWLSNGTVTRLDVRTARLYATLPLNLVFHTGGFFIGSGGNIGLRVRDKRTYGTRESSTYYRFNLSLPFFGIQAFAGYEFPVRERLMAAIYGIGSTTLKPGYLNLGIGVGLKYLSLSRFVKPVD